jgi:hypothetical protein
VELTHDQHHVTHQIAPDIDAERDLLTAHVKAANVVETIYQVTGIGPTLQAIMARVTSITPMATSRSFS